MATSYNETGNHAIGSNYLASQRFYPNAPYLNSSVLFDGGITSNHFPGATNTSGATAAHVFDGGPWGLPSPDFSNPRHSVSGLTTPYVRDGGPWASLSPGFSISVPSVSGLTAAYVSDDRPWASLGPDFSNPHAPQVTVNHSFYPTSNSYNSTSSPYAANSYTADSSGDTGRMAETSQPILDDGTNLTASSANASRQRVMKPRPVCKTCRKSFSRPSDLDRHAKKHQPGARIHMCSVPGCDYEGSYRKDKLTAHVKNCHK